MPGCNPSFGTCGLAQYSSSSFGSSTSTATSFSQVPNTLSTVRAVTSSTSSSTRSSTSSSTTGALVATTIRTSSVRPSASACTAVAAPAITLSLTASDCCEYYITKAGDTCASIPAKNSFLGLDVALLLLLNPSLRCIGQGPQIGVAVCILNIQLSLSGSLISPPDTTSSSTVVAPTSTQVVPSSFFIRASNSGTSADGSDLMIQQSAEYLAGFNLPYGQQVLPFSYDPETGYVASGLYILWATASFSPPSIKVAPIGYNGWIIPAWPLVCSVDNSLKLTCRANGNIYNKWILENGTFSF